MDHDLTEQKYSIKSIDQSVKKIPLRTVLFKTVKLPPKIADENNSSSAILNYFDKP